METEPIITLAANVRGTLKDYTRKVITDCMRAAGVDWLFITSMERTPRSQALAMFTNIKNTGAEKQRKLYGPYGDLVIDVCEAGRKMGFGETQLVERMTKEIIRLGAQNVSRHCADSEKCQVIDISPKSIVPLERFAALEKVCRADARISKVKSPADGDPALHLEVPAPKVEAA